MRSIVSLQGKESVRRWKRLTKKKNMRYAKNREKLLNQEKQSVQHKIQTNYETESPKNLNEALLKEEMSGEELPLFDEALKGSFVTGQDRIPFGFSWVTTIVNDDKGTAFGYRVHLAYGCLASPSSQENVTINDSPSLKEFSW